MILTYKDEYTLEQAINRVSEYGCGSEIRFFDIQPIELCLAAVRQDGYALDYVRDQTPEICLAAVRQDGYALKYVRDQTPEICLAAVRQDGYALDYVRDQTPEICLEAAKKKHITSRLLSIKEEDE